MLIPKSSIYLFTNSLSFPFIILSTDFSISSFFPKYFINSLSLEYQAIIFLFSLQLKQISCLFIISISIKLEFLTSESCSSVLWAGFSSILDANSDSLIIYLPKISFATHLALLNSAALRYYFSKVRPSFLPPISTSL